MTLVDSHCHLDDAQFDADREAVIGRALDAGVGRMVVIGTGDDPEAGVRMAETHPAILATAGVHPHAASMAGAALYRKLEELLAHPKVIALGETGLDYHYNFSPPETQREVFAAQLRLAREHAKPVIIHTREAWDDTFRLLAEHWAPAGLAGILHCFTGGAAEARRALDMGFYISFGGIVTFPRSLEIQQAARAVPGDKILVETDAPYLAPVPHRGRRNEPAFVVETARRLAELRGESFEDLARATTCNFLRLFPAASTAP